MGEAGHFPGRRGRLWPATNMLTSVPERGPSISGHGRQGRSCRLLFSKYKTPKVKRNLHQASDWFLILWKIYVNCAQSKISNFWILKISVFQILLVLILMKDKFCSAIKSANQMKPEHSIYLGPFPIWLSVFNNKVITYDSLPWASTYKINTIHKNLYIILSI